MKAMILAAGYGTRFRPATYATPKPLLPLANRPLIAWVGEALLEAGVDTLVVNLHHLPEALEAYVRNVWSDRATLHFSFEPEILGTGGGVRKVQAIFEGESTFLLANGDTVQSPPFRDLIRAREEADAIAALLLRHPPEGDRYTAVWFDRGRVNGFGGGQGEALMFSGAHALSPRVLGRLPDREFSGITEDVYIPVTREEGEHLAGVVHDGPWFDIGTPGRYLVAMKAILSGLLDGSIEPPGCSVVDRAVTTVADETARIEGDVRCSTVGEESAVGRGATVERSALWSRSEAGADSVVEDSILDFGVRLPAGTVARNVLISPALAIDYPDGITTIGEYAVTPAVAGKPWELKLGRSGNE